MDDAEEKTETETTNATTEKEFKQEAGRVYAQYQGLYRKRFKWIRPELFNPLLAKHLREDANTLMGILQNSGSWNPAHDAKLEVLLQLISKKYPDSKVLVFSHLSHLYPEWDDFNGSLRTPLLLGEDGLEMDL